MLIPFLLTCHLKRILTFANKLFENTGRVGLSKIEFNPFMTEAVIIQKTVH